MHAFRPPHTQINHGKMRVDLVKLRLAVASLLLVIIYFSIPPKSAPLPLLKLMNTEGEDEDVVQQRWEVCESSVYALEDLSRSVEIIVDRIAWGAEPLGNWYTECPNCLRNTYTIDAEQVMNLVPLQKTAASRIIRGGYIGPIWDRPTASLGPVYSACSHTISLGKPGEDEERVICIPPEVAKVQGRASGAACTIFSVGSNNQFSFETEMAQRSACTIHTFDCTVRNPHPPDGVVYHNLCLGSKNETMNDGREFASFADLVQLTGGFQPDLIKIDIEGWEWIALVDMMESAAKAEEEEDKNIYPDQIALEIHFHDIPWSYGYFWEREVLAYSNYLFYEHGYVIGSFRANPWCRTCFEVLLVKLKC